MITRAQAEALLTLAESLEACERLGLQMSAGEDGEWLFYKNGLERVGEFSAENLRAVIAKLIPNKTE